METITEIDMACPHCGEHFKFPREGIGQLAPCPHCNEEVRLSAPKPKRKQASQKPILLYEGGVEGWLDLIGVWVVALGVLGGGAVVVCGGLAAPVIWILCVSGGAAIMGGIIMGVVLKTLAEIVRLLKLRNGLNYSGEILEPRFQQKVFACSACKTPVHEHAKDCSACGAEFLKT